LGFSVASANADWSFFTFATPGPSEYTKDTNGMLKHNGTRKPRAETYFIPNQSRLLTCPEDTFKIHHN